MKEKEIKDIIKKEIAPLLIGLRNDLADNQKALEKISEEVKKKSVLEYDLEVDDLNYKGEKGDTPIKDIDYPSHDTLFSYIKENLPKKAKDLFTDLDIKNIAIEASKLIPKPKDGVNGKDGINGKDVDYTLVKELIKTKENEIKKEIKSLTDRLYKEIKEKKTPIDIDEVIKGLEKKKGSQRLDAKAIKNLGDYVQTFIATSVGGGGGGGSTGGLTNPVDYIQFNTLATPEPNAEGLLQWNATDGTLDLGMSGGDIKQQIGQELFMKVRNVSGSTIPNGTPVYVSGRTGNRPNIYPARSDVDATAEVIGLTTQDIASPADGFVTTFGYVRQIKTNYSGTGAWGTTWTEGDKLYISKTVAGQLTNVEPSGPHHSDVVATVEIVGNTGIGSLLVNINQHKTLQELSDVNGTALTADGQIPTWHNTEKYFDFDKNINDYLLSSTASSTYVPYTGATSDVNLGTHNLTLAGYIDIGISGTDAIVLGDVSGNARGTQAIDIQAYRSAVDYVASGPYSTAVGWNNKVTGFRGGAFGYNNTVTGGNRANAFGVDNVVSGTRGQAFGNGNSTTGSFASTFGISCTAFGSNSTAVGQNCYAIGALSFASGYLAVANGTYSGAYGWDSLVSGQGSFVIGTSIVNSQKDTFKLGNSYSAMTFNANGFSINNENPLTAFHATGKTLVTDITSLGSELVTNGSFTGGATGWTLGDGWSSTTTYATKQADGVGTLSQPLTIVAGKYYYVSVALASLSVGSMTVSVGGATSPILYADSGPSTKTWKGVFKATTTDGIVITPLSTETRIAIVDDVSVKEITGGDVELLGNVLLPTTSSTVGNIKVNGVLRQHWYGTDNFFLGGSTGPAGNYTCTGANNFFAGRYSGFVLSSGSGNVGMGDSALAYVSTGGNNVALGSNAGKNISTGGNNFALGLNSLTSLTTGFNNVAIGVSSLSNTIGSYNVGIGGTAGVGNTTGEYNVFIGYGATCSAGNFINATAIGFNAVAGASNTVILGNGAKVGIGTSTPSDLLTVAGALTTNFASIANFQSTVSPVAGQNFNNMFSRIFINPTENAFGSNASGTQNVVLKQGNFNFHNTNGYGMIANQSTFSVSGNGGVSGSNFLSRMGFEGNSGQVYEFMHFNITSPYQAGTGTIDAIYGVYMNAQKQSYVTTAYGMYQVGADDLNYFAGKVGIGTATPNSTLQVTGSLSLSYVAKTATYTVTASDHTIDCTANTFTVTLPTAVGITGRIYNIKNSGTGTITVACAGAETIDGITTQTLYQYDCIKLQSTGNNFIII